MLIGVMSDAHGSLYWFDRAMQYFKNSNVDYILYLGDLLYHGPRNPLPRDYAPAKLAEKIKNTDNMFLIRGNCDAKVDEMVTGKRFEEKMIFFFKDLKVIAIHGDEVDNYNHLSIKYNDYNVVIFGHFHLPIIEKTDATFLFSPGSISLPKDGNPNSLGFFDTISGIIEIIDMTGKTLKKSSLKG